MGRSLLLLRALRRALVPIAVLVSGGMALAVAAEDWSGIYGIRSRTDARELRVEPNDDGTYLVSASVSRAVAPHCLGGVDDSVGRLQGGRIVTVPPRGESCSLTITRTATGMSVREGAGCSGSHGMACDFNGDYPRLGGASLPASQASAAGKAAPESGSGWLVGAWVAEGRYCESSAPISLKADGTYFSGPEIEGRWRVANGSIALNYTVGGLDEKRSPVRRETHAVRRTGPDDMMLDAVRYKRCPEGGGAEPWHPQAGKPGPRAPAAGSARRPAAAGGGGRSDLGRPLSDYTELYNPAQFNLLFAAVSPRPNYEMLAKEYATLAVGGFMGGDTAYTCQLRRGCDAAMWQNSRDYARGADSFRTRDAFTALQPRLAEGVAAFKASPYAWVITGGGIDHYDFARRGFPVRALMGRFQMASVSMNESKAFVWSNPTQASFASVPDEALARQIETMITNKTIALRIYFVAQSAVANQNIPAVSIRTNNGILSHSSTNFYDGINARVTRVQFVDQRGRTLLDYAP